MEGRSMEVAKVCKKMDKHVFDGENIDLKQVMKDLHDNFTRIYKATISQLENLERKFHMYRERDFVEMKKTLGLLITFSRCMLKRCVDKDGVINMSFVDILTDVESHFVDILERCTTQLSSCEKFEYLQQLEFLKMGSIKHMVSRVSDEFAAVFSKESSPSDFIYSVESVLESVDHVENGLHQSDMKNNNIRTSIDKLEFLRNCFQFTKDRISREALKEFLIGVELFAERAACYSFLTKYGKSYSWEQKLGVGVFKALVLKLQDYSSDHIPRLTDGLLKGYVDCVQENLTKLMNDDESVDPMTMQMRYQFEDLHKELKFLAVVVLSYSPQHESELEKLSDIRAQFQTLATNVGSMLVLFLNDEMRRNMATERTTNLGISDLLQKAHLLKDHITDILLHITFCRIGRNSPQANQLGFLSNLIDNLWEFKESTFNFTGPSGFQVIFEDLVLLRTYLQNTVGNKTTSAADNDEEESKDLCDRIRHAVYQAEYFINSSVAGACPDWCRSHWFSDFKEQVEQIKATFADISEERPTNVRMDHNMDINDVGISNNPNQVAVLPLTDVVVGFEDEMKLIKERLTSDLGKLDVVSVIGMPGLGKTTFAKKVYEDPSIVEHFQIRAWCCVSQEYNKKELLLTILGSIIELTDLIRRKTEGDLSVMLHQQLTGRTYLIVMDDIWEINALRELKRFFPDNSNRSRIMSTSRNRLEDYSDPLELRLLTDDESWDLLKLKVHHQDEGCHLGLSQVGKKIAEKCRGLPLAIVVVAGILAKSEKKRDFWEQVAGNLSLYIAGDTTHGQVMAALELSYKLLPDHLKPLFLYLGVFPEDKEIPADKLTWLWLAEGFVHKTDNQLTISLEHQAELNLADLIDRSLVMIAERRSDGRVKSCRVHDLLRDMCLRKAKEENFFQQINLQNESPAYSVTYERRLGLFLNRSYTRYAVTHERPIVTCEGLSMLSIPPPLSSFLFFDMNKSLPLSDEDSESFFRNFRLLRILHFESMVFDANTCRDHLVMLVQLRYISIRTDLNLIPSSISKLRNLETLIIKGLRGEIVVPEEIWELVKLRHLHIDPRADFSKAVVLESSSKLENLETLSTPAISFIDEERLISRVPNLKKFSCVLVEDRKFYRGYYQLPQLQFLTQLESLKICYCRKPHPSQFSLPSTLKKLTLSKFRLQWSEISSFQNLPNLEVLKLRVGAVEDELWDTGDGEFPKLKYLKLECLNIKKWIVSAENFPCLKKLVLLRCKQLEEIPSSVGYFYSLEKIELSWCSHSSANSAIQIQEEQRDEGNELLKVQTYMSVGWKLRPASHF